MTNLDFYRVQKLDYIVSKFEPQTMKKAPEIVHRSISSPEIEPLTAVYEFLLVQILDTLLIYQVYGCTNYTENMRKTCLRHLHERMQSTIGNQDAVATVNPLFTLTLTAIYCILIQ